MRCIEEILVFYDKQCTYNPQKSQGHPKAHSCVTRPEVFNRTQVYGNCTKIVTSGGQTDRYPRQLLTFKSDKQKTNLHPTQKPLALIEYLIKTFSNPKDTVLDFCMGAGTTGLACKNLHRNFIGIEKEREFFNVTIRRLNETMHQMR